MIDGYADSEPRSRTLQACGPPGSYSIQRKVFGCLVVYAIEPSVPSTSMIQVFVSPGAIRFVSIRSGKESPSASTSQRRRALSHVSHGTVPPRPSGRERTTSDRIARTSFGNQPARRGRCRACMPRSPMTPYSPFWSARRFQLIGLPGSRSLEWRKADRTSSTRP